MDPSSLEQQRPAAGPARVATAPLLLLLALPLAGLAGGYYLKETGQLPSLRARSAAAPPPPGVGLPVNNRMDERFADADGDLVADPPADPKQQVDPDRVVVSVPPDGGTAEQDWQPLADHLARAAGRPVRLVAAGAGGGGAKEQLRALRQGAAHLAVLPPGSVPTAVNACGFVPVARLPGADGSGWAKMKLVVPAESAYRSPAELRGKQFTFTNPTSNAGFKAAVVVLRSDFGFLPGRDFTWTFSGGNEESVRALKEQRAWAVALADDVLARAVGAGELKPDEFRVIYESEPFPAAAVGYAHDLTPDLARRVREALLSFDWKGTPLEQRLGAARTRFVPADYRNDWSLVRRIDDATGAAHVVE